MLNPRRGSCLQPLPVSVTHMWFCLLSCPWLCMFWWLFLLLFFLRTVLIAVFIPLHSQRGQRGPFQWMFSFQVNPFLSSYLKKIQHLPLVSRFNHFFLRNQFPVILSFPSKHFLFQSVISPFDVHHQRSSCRYGEAKCCKQGCIMSMCACSCWLPLLYSNNLHIPLTHTVNICSFLHIKMHSLFYYTCADLPFATPVRLSLNFLERYKYNNTHTLLSVLHSLMSHWTGLVSIE